MFFLYQILNITLDHCIKMMFRESLSNLYQIHKKEISIEKAIEINSYQHTSN